METEKVIREKLETLACFSGHILVSGRAPTLQELSNLLNVSIPTAQSRLDRLVDGGLLNKDPGVARGYSLTSAGRRVALVAESEIARGRT